MIGKFGTLVSHKKKEVVLVLVNQYGSELSEDEMKVANCQNYGKSWVCVERTTKENVE